MFDFNAVVELAGMLSSLAVVFLVLEAGSIALPAAVRRARTWMSSRDDTVSWSTRREKDAYAGTAPASARSSLHTATGCRPMNSLPIRQAA